jgi:phosphoribosyl-ATP pyrophosphohydrolase
MTDEINELFTTIQNRKNKTQPGSYTNQLLAVGEDEIVKKIGEEAIEIILAAKSQGNQRIIEESADLIYHILVLLAARDLTWEDVLTELARRRR